VRETVARVILKPVTAEIAALALRLPGPFPRVRADRLIASTAMVEGMPHVTADSAAKGVGYGLVGVGIRHGSIGPMSLGPPDSRGRLSPHFSFCPNILSYCVPTFLVRGGLVPVRLGYNVL
jgi:hypothetical protein